MPFPTSFPVSAIPTVIGFLRGTGVGRRDAAEAAYDLAGYGLNVALPANVTTLASTKDDLGDPLLLTDVQLASHLEDFKSELDTNPNAAFSLPPWLVVVLLEVLRRVVSN